MFGDFLIFAAWTTSPIKNIRNLNPLRHPIESFFLTWTVH